MQVSILKATRTSPTCSRRTYRLAAGVMYHHLQNGVISTRRTFFLLKEMNRCWLSMVRADIMTVDFEPKKTWPGRQMPVGSFQVGQH